MLNFKGNLSKIDYFCLKQSYVNNSTMKKIYLLVLFLSLSLLYSCQQDKISTHNVIDFGDYSLSRVNLYTPENKLDNNQKQIIINLVRAARYADSIYLIQNAGDYASLLYTLKDKKKRLRFKINFGPWDIFHNNLPFIEGIPSKPKGAYFYPQDMLISEFYDFTSTCKFSHYTMIRRDRQGKLMCIPYHIFFKNYIDSAIYYIKRAQRLTEDTAFSSYLSSLTSALRTDKYYNFYKKFINLGSRIEFIFGPTDITIDKLLNIKADYQSLVLIKDDSLSQKLNQYVKWLKYLQKALPVPEKYRQEEPGESSLIAVYDAIFLGGSAKAGAPIIATTIPFNAQFQLTVGTKNIQLRNVIYAKYQGVIKPLIKLVIVKSQAKYITPQAFQDITLLYEIGNSLGIRNTIDNKGSVRQALKETYTVSNYIKNYLMVLYLAEKLHSVGELTGSMKEYYYTFVVNLIRGIRWGSENDYGLANLIIINYLYKKEALTFLPTGQIVINYDTMKDAIRNMLSKVLIIQGNGDYDSMKKLILSNKYISTDLQELVNNLNKAKVPIDIYINQTIKF